MKGYETRYLAFVKLASVAKIKTDVWDVRSVTRPGLVLGQVRWYGPWRQYCFWPARETVFNRECLESIESFIGKLMEERRAMR